MSPSMAELIEDEQAFDEYLATLKHEPEDLEEMDVFEVQRRVNDMVERLDGIRFTHGGSVGAVRLA